MKKVVRILSFFLLVTCFSLSAVHARTVKGELTTIKGKPVLRVWGTHYDMGYAHGYLLAEGIYDMLENFLLADYLDVPNYDKTRRMLLAYTRIPLIYRIELQGVYDGMLERLGRSGLYSPTINRIFKPVDLIAWNMTAEIFRISFTSRSLVDLPGLLCSSISGWGEGTADGNLVFARNLDFGRPGDVLERSSLIIAYQPSGWFKSDWVSVAWPGYVGCITGMNEEGVGAALNLGNDPPDIRELFLKIGDLYLGIPLYYTSTAFILRQGIENIRLLSYISGPVRYFQRILRNINILGSFDIHVFTPSNSDMFPSYPPAAIIECNHKGTVIRTADDNQDYDPRLYSDYYLAVTNHHRKLAVPIYCERYDTLVDRLNDTEVLDMERALDIERDVAYFEGPYNTVYITGFKPDTLEMWVSFPEDGLTAPESEPTYFSWEDIFGN